MGYDIHTMLATTHSSALHIILTQCIRSVDPGYLVRTALEKEAGSSNTLKIRNLALVLNNNCYIVGFGKAVYKMAVELERVLDSHLQDGIISIPEGSLEFQSSRLKLNSIIRVFEGAKNNLPDENAYEAAVQIKSLVQSCSEKGNILFVLISGGGSALLPHPIPPLTLAEKYSTIKLLASAGGDITQLNTVRKALSVLKGGKLAYLAHPATTIALILSDVVGDLLDVIAAGPTVLSCKNEGQEAIKVLKELGLQNSVPENVKKILQCETDHKDKVMSFCNTDQSLWLHNIIVGNNATALVAAKTEAERLGYAPIIISSKISGLVSHISTMYSELIISILRYWRSNLSEIDFIKNLQQLCDRSTAVGGAEDIVENIEKHADLVMKCRSEGRKLLLIGGGEPTVIVGGCGLGGRNQELALEMAIRLHNLRLENEKLMEKADVVCMSAGTDGIDGPTDAAGALSYLDMVDEAAAEFSLQAMTYLQNNDSYSFFSKFRNGSCHIKTGHTGTNVMDTHFLIVGEYL